MRREAIPCVRACVCPAVHASTQENPSVSPPPPPQTYSPKLHLSGSSHTQSQTIASTQSDLSYLKEAPPRGSLPGDRIDLEGAKRQGRNAEIVGLPFYNPSMEYSSCVQVRTCCCILIMDGSVALHRTKRALRIRHQIALRSTACFNFEGKGRGGEGDGWQWHGSQQDK